MPHGTRILTTRSAEKRAGSAHGRGVSLIADVLFELSPGEPGLLNRTLVFDGRDIARLPIENHGLEHPAHDLAAARLRQHADEVQIADDGDRAELAPYGVEQRLPQLRRRVVAELEQHESGDHLASQLV